MVRFAFLISVCLLMGCSDVGVPPLVGYNSHFKLQYSHTVRLPDGEEIRFKDVLEDSRCPVDVVCIWEGNARVLLTVAGEAIVLNTALDPKHYRYAGGTVRLLNVEPARYHRQEMIPHRYVITLMVER